MLCLPTKDTTFGGWLCNVQVLGVHWDVCAIVNDRFSDDGQPFGSLFLFSVVCWQASMIMGI